MVGIIDWHDIIVRASIRLGFVAMPTPEMPVLNTGDVVPVIRIDCRDALTARYRVRHKNRPYNRTTTAIHYGLRRWKPSPVPQHLACGIGVAIPGFETAGWGDEK